MRCDAELVAVLMLVFLILPVLILPSAFAEPNSVTHLTNSNVIQLGGIDVTVTASHTSGTTGNLILSVQLLNNPLTNTPLGIDQFYYNAANGVVSVSDPGCLPPKNWDFNKGGKTADSFGQFDSDKSQCGGGDGGIAAPIVFTIGGDPLIPTNARSAKYALHLRFSDECSGWISDGVAESPESNSGCTPKNGKIIVRKVTVPSPDLTQQDFSFNLTGGPDGVNQLFSLKNGESHDSGAVKPGTYATAESVPAGWDMTSATCDDGSSVNAIDLAAGETVTCTFTDTKLPTLTVIKKIVNDNGGTATLADFTPLKVGDTTVVNGSKTGFNVGTYTVSETLASGYSATFSGDCDSSTHQVTLAAGDDKTCTITNDDLPPTLEVSKTASTFLSRTYQWTINKSVTPDTWTLPTGESGTSTYTVSVEKTGYTDSDWLVNGTITLKNTGQTSVTIVSVSDTISPAMSATVDCAGASFPYELAADATLKCTYSASLPNNSSRTNTATVTVGASQFNATAAVDFNAATVKEVYGSINVDDTNDDRAWTFTESSSASYTKTFTCNIDQGQHNNTATIRETGQFDDATVMVECSGGQTAALTVIKHVISDHEGMKEAKDFMIHVMYYDDANDLWVDVVGSPQNGTESGTLYTGLSPGLYRVSEDPPPPLYVQWGISGDCDPDDGTVTVEANSNKVCTITNKDPALVVIKHVIGGSNSASDFTISVDGKNAMPAVFPGSESGTRVVLDPGPYGVTETPIAGYTTTYSADCSGTVVVGEPTRTCIITNENSGDRPPQPVGGELYSVDKSALVQPYVGLLGLLGAVATTVAITRGRRP